MECNVLLLGGGLQVLSVASSLKQVGCIVSVALNNDIIAYSSRFIAFRYKSPDINNENEYKAFILNLLKKHPQQVIIPMEDPYAVFLSKNKKELEDYNVICATQEYDIFISAYDKWSFMQFCKNNNICHPKTINLSFKTLSFCAEYVGFPSIIKPNFSTGARGITYVNNKEELINKYPQVYSKYGKCTLQEYVDNLNYYYNVMIYRDAKGIYHNYTIIKIIRFYPVTGGSSCFSESVNNFELLEFCKNILDKLNWIGFADLDILFDEKISKYKVIELNPRVPASIRAAQVSNVNFPLIIVSDALKLPIPQYKYKTGMYLRYLGLDLLWFLKSQSRFNASPSFFVFFSRKLFFQEGSIKDPIPFIMSLITGVFKYFRIKSEY